MNILGKGRRRPTYAAVTSTLALVVALGGTSYAAVRLDGHDIQRHSIPADRLAKGAVVPKAKTAERTKQIVVARDKKRRGAARATGEGSQLIRLDAGETATLFSVGPFQVRVGCQSASRVSVTGSSTEAGWFVSTTTVGTGTGAGPHEANTPVLLWQTDVGGNPTLNPVEAFEMVTPTGDVFHVGPLAVGNNVLGSACVVTGYAVSQ